MSTKGLRQEQKPQKKETKKIKINTILKSIYVNFIFIVLEGLVFFFVLQCNQKKIINS
jgi:hypothetical protein